MSFRENLGYQRASFTGNINKACEGRAGAFLNISVSVFMMDNLGDWDF